MEDKKSYVITEYTLSEMPKIPMPIDPDILTKYKFKEKPETQSAFIRFTKEELEALLLMLDFCHTEGYLNYGDIAYVAWVKLIEANDNFNANNGE